jgi:sacsin
MAASTDGVVDFGQSVDLTSRIREVLRGYPEGTAVFKELLQNADDAGARTFTLCLDLRSHDASLSSLLPGASAAAASLQGPALLAYNDASFTAADFVGISRLGDSGKAAGAAGSRVGRFGLGFNAVFHLTDVPCFVSATRAVFFDPSCAYLPGVAAANPGKAVD